MGRRLFPLLLATFLAFYLSTSGGRLYVNDSFVKLMTARALLDRGTLAIPPHGALTAVSPEDGRTYAKFEVLHSLLFLPAVAAGELAVGAGLVPAEKRALADAAFASLLAPLAAALAVAFLFLWARSVFGSEAGALRASLLFGIATMFWPYAKRCWTEVPQTAFLVAAAYLLDRAGRRRSRALFFGAGAVLGGAVSLRVTGIVLVPFYAAALVTGSGQRDLPRRALSFAAGFLLPVLPLVLGANWIRYADPISLFQWRMGGFTTNFFVGLFGLVASPGESIFLYSPILIAAVPLFPLLRATDRGAFVLAAFAPVALLLLYASWWFHAYTWGPRFLLPALPFLALPFAHPQARERLRHPLFLTLLVLSIGLQLLGVFLHAGDLPELEKPLFRHGLIAADHSLTREETWFHPLRTRPVSHLLIFGESVAAVFRGEKPKVRPDLWPFALEEDLGVPLGRTLPVEILLSCGAVLGLALLVRRAVGPQGSGSV